MKGEHHDAELAHGDEAANARDDEGHEVPEVRGEWKFYHRAYEERKCKFFPTCTRATRTTSLLKISS